MGIMEKIMETTFRVQGLGLFVFRVPVRARV